MNNEIIITPKSLEYIQSMCEPEILEPCMNWLDVKMTKETDYWNCSDFLTIKIDGVERIDKIQLVSLFMTIGKINFLADFCIFLTPIELWNKMRDLKLMEENEYNFLVNNWSLQNYITRANL